MRSTLLVLQIYLTITTTYTYVEPKTTPPPPPSMIDWESFSEEFEEGETIAPASHYVTCTGKYKNYCLNEGECKILPDGRYIHCR